MPARVFKQNVRNLIDVMNVIINFIFIYMKHHRAHPRVRSGGTVYSK